jgi:hypothetical protein
MDFGPTQIAKWLIVMGICLCGIGALMLVAGKFGLFRLPGDVSVGGKNWHVFMPITSCLVISAVLTLLMWIISKLSK